MSESVGVGCDVVVELKEKVDMNLGVVDPCEPIV